MASVHPLIRQAVDTKIALKLAQEERGYPGNSEIYRFYFYTIVSKLWEKYGAYFASGSSG